MEKMEKKQEIRWRAVDCSPITYDKIRILEFNFIHIEQIKISQKVNEHARLDLEVIAEEEVYKEIMNRNWNDEHITIAYTDDAEKKEKILFCGLIREVGISVKKGLSVLEIKAFSDTIKLDDKKESRSFQNTEMTYDGILQTILQKYKGALAINFADRKEPIHQFLIQYKETDWEFLKRIASMQHVALMPDIQSPNPHIYYGTRPFEKGLLLSQMDYFYLKKVVEQKDILYSDGNESEIRSNAILQLGDILILNERFYIIYEAEYTIIDGEVKGTYRCYSGVKILKAKKESDTIAGVSLKATVKGVQRDRVCVQLDLDQNRVQSQEENGNYYFPYATISASSDGSGWYFMPEIGDRVRLYFPDSKEQNAYVVSSISEYTPSEKEQDRMEDPDIKYIRTIYHHQILFRKDGIQISANDGKAEIWLDKNGSISLKGSNKISIEASENLEIKAQNSVVIEAVNQIQLSGNGGEILLDEMGGVLISGNYIEEN